MSLRRRLLSISISVPVGPGLEILTDDNYTGKYFYCTATYDDIQVFGTWAITSGNQYATINNNGKVDIVSGTVSQAIVISLTYQGETVTKTVLVTYDNQLVIEGPSSMTGTSGNLISRYNGDVVSSTWSVISGSGATIDNTGAVTITASGSITVQAVYSTYTDTKTITLTYEAGTSTSTEVNEDGSVTTTTTTTETDPETGAVIENTVAQTVNEDGSISNTTATQTTNEDGSYTSESTTTNQDGSSSTTNSIGNADGSSETHGTSYDANGDPTDAFNNEVDVSGNSSTQTIEYENGEPVVSGYTIDTSENPEGEKSIQDGVNTQYYAFDTTRGFVVHIEFEVDMSNKPPGQNENHHNILTAKRSSPSPWYGFQLRQSNNTKNIIIGTQFATGSNTNTNITPSILTGNWGYYDLTITYDPTLARNQFVCYDNYGQKNIATKTGTFPDIDELKYLKMTLGCALDENGNEYRFANLHVYDFSVQRLPGA